MTFHFNAQQSTLDRAMLAQLCNLLPCAALILGSPQRRIVHCNPALADLFGYSVDDLIGEPVEILCSPTDREMNEAAVLAGTDAGRPWGGQLRGRRADGTAIMLQVEARELSVTGQPEEKFLLELIRPLTGPTREQQALMEARARYHALLSDIPEAVIVFDAETLKVLEVNETAVQRYGHSRADWLQMTIMDIRPADQYTRTLQAVSSTTEDRVAVHEQIIHRRKDGSVFPVDVYTRLHKLEGRNIIVAVCVDISEKLRAQEHRRASELRYRTLVESSSDMIFTLDEDLCIASVNAPLARVLNISPDQVAGRRVGEFTGALPAVAEGRRIAEECFQTGRARIYEPTINWQGRDVSLNVSFSPITDSAGRTRQLVVMVRNVTPVREMERKLAQTHKLDALGRLAGGIAHDFNNLLACIQGNLDLALMGDVGDPANRQGLTSAREASERAAVLVRHILAFTRQSRVRPVKVDLNATVAEAMRMLRGSLSDKIYTAHEGAEDLWPVCIDPSQAIQVLMNLCLNARDAMPAGGKLIISTANVTLDQQFCHRHAHARPGPFAQVSVIDTGTGIAPETMDKIFEPFFTTKPVGEGSGLGLSVAYGIITQAGGWIDVTSAPGQGSRFDVYVPKDGETVN